MNILFICPSVSRVYCEHIEAIARKGWPNAGFLKRDIRRHNRYAGRVFYGLGLLTLASGLGKEIKWTFVDENLDKEKVNRYEETPFDLVAITGQVIQRHRILELIRYFTELGTYIVIGGVHATGFREDYSQRGVSVIAGEGETLFKRFLDDYARSRPQPCYTQGIDTCLDLSASPAPDFSAVAHYPYNLIGVQTTRGCPYRCRYCNVSTMLGETYRHKSIDQVRDEVERVKGIWPRSMFYFYDDNLFGDREYAFRLFENLKDIHLGHWGTHADISISQDTELLDLIRSNGHPHLAIGFETLSEKNAAVLGNRMKAALLDRYDEGVSLLKRKGVEISGSFMFGFEGDTSVELDRIMAFIKRHKIRGYITRYAVIPGSPLYDDILEEYESTRGPVPEGGTRKARILNEFFMKKNGFGWWDTENLIIEALKTCDTAELPLSQIDALAVFRSFFVD